LRISATIGGSNHLHRLGQRETLAADHRVDRQVQVLRVRGTGGDLDRQHLRLLAQLSIVLISPLWPSTENGCTRLKEGQVLVE